MKCVRGAQPLVHCHGSNGVGSFGGSGGLSVSLVSCSGACEAVPAFVLKAAFRRWSLLQFHKMKRVWVIGLLVALLAFGE